MTNPVILSEAKDPGGRYFPRRLLAYLTRRQLERTLGPLARRKSQPAKSPLIERQYPLPWRTARS